jgi:hypothetical protein
MDGIFARIDFDLDRCFLFRRSHPRSSWYGISTEQDKEYVCFGIDEFDEDVDKAETRDTI